MPGGWVVSIGRGREEKRRTADCGTERDETVVAAEGTDAEPFEDQDGR